MQEHLLASSCSLGNWPSISNHDSEGTCNSAKIVLQDISTSFHADRPGLSKGDQSTGKRDSLPSWARGSGCEVYWGKTASRWDTKLTAQSHFALFPPAISPSLSHPPSFSF